MPGRPQHARSTEQEHHLRLRQDTVRLPQLWSRSRPALVGQGCRHEQLYMSNVSQGIYMLVYHDSHCCNSPDWSIVAHVNRLLTYFFTSDVSSRYQLIQEETENFFIYKILLCVIFV